MRKQRYYGSTDLAGNTNANGEIKTIGRFRVEPADSVEGEIYVRTLKHAHVTKTYCIQYLRSCK